MLKYICLSDLHAGALTSLLTDLRRPKDGGRLSASSEKVSETTLAFKTALAAFLGRAVGTSPTLPQLILLGDVLDLQFSRRKDATGAALGFLRGLGESGLLSKDVIATAGNHDHALWTEARLSLEAEAFTRDPDDPDYRSSTGAFPDTPAARSRLLEHVLKEAGFGSCEMRYPNLGFQNDERMVFLHHGHFVESEYRLMTRMQSVLSGHHDREVTADLLAAENAGWIDFAWSSFGDAAGLGRGVETLYQYMLTTTGFRRLSAQWSEAAAGVLSDILPMSGTLSVQDMLRTLTRVGFDVTLGAFPDTERYAEVDTMTRHGMEELSWYLEEPVARQILGAGRELPEDLTFVFGHTHKPFTERVAARGFAKPVKVYNTGGWTLNGPRLDNAEGAAMVLIDDALNTASVRLFSTPRNGEMAPVRVEMLSEGGAGAAGFKAEIEGWLEDTEEVWRRLSDVVREAYEVRQEFLLQLTAEELDHRIGARAAE